MLVSFKIFPQNPFIAEKQKMVNDHLQTAALFHIKASNDLKEGRYGKAAHNALLAQKYLDLASENKREEENQKG